MGDSFGYSVAAEHELIMSSNRTKPVPSYNCIKYNKSAWSPPVIVAPKKNEKHRFRVDECHH